MMLRTGGLVVLCCGFACFGLAVHAQSPLPVGAPPLSLPGLSASPTPPSLPGSLLPVDARQPVGNVRATPATAAWARQLEQDPRALSPLANQVLQASRRGCDWLVRANTTKGIFTSGIDPATATEPPATPMGQVKAAWSLARASAAFGDERYEMRALQALLACLEETLEEAGDPQARHTAAPSVVISRPAGTACLLAAICALEKPPAELLDKADQLARYLSKPAVLAAMAAASKVEPSTPFLAAHALLSSNRHRPASWKLDAARAAVGVQVPAEQQAGAAAWMLMATSDLAKHDSAASQRVGSLAQSLISRQMDKVDARHPGWFGGWSSGRTLANGELEAPTCVASAEAIWALAEAATVARQEGDLNLHQKLKDGMDRGSQFLLQLQLTDANTQHFAEWFRPKLAGGFRPGPGSTTLTLDQNHAALAALLGCAREGAH